jgi:hypothetical protein
MVFPLGGLSKLGFASRFAASVDRPAKREATASPRSMAFAVLKRILSFGFQVSERGRGEPFIACRLFIWVDGCFVGVLLLTEVLLNFAEKGEMSMFSGLDLSSLLW